MILQIEATSDLTTIDGVHVRRWRGTTAGGIECDVFVHLIAALSDKDTAEFDRELVEQLPPGRTVELGSILT